ncbi:HTH_Tnp_Tc3_2 domain-containing protein [Trichonephila clavipes]|uniref:HTH_Tnp_Tc3_2 domain-containing protein n=1 Tax=Trichonephila clavipes TaxID=2585209 RepID=A0A8X7BB51_TRICX|nr:HTH_Tnp_Tc3_2 domain-containing protein [Trichonephila clavipes]
MTVSRIWNRWVQDGNTECRAGSQRPPITSSREDRHVTCMALMYRAATSRTLSQELGSFARQVSARTVRRRFPAAWTLSSDIMAAATLDAASQIGASSIDNSRPHVSSIVRTFLDTENVRLSLWPARSPDLSPLENVCSMVAERLARHHTPVTTVDKLWDHVEAARSSVPVHAMQSRFDSMPGV